MGAPLSARDLDTLTRQGAADRTLESRTSALLEAMNTASGDALVAMMIRLDQRMLDLGWVRPAGINRAARRRRRG